MSFSDVTELKLNILKSGFRFAPQNLFTPFLSEQGYKCKTIFKNPVSNGKSVYDFSENNNLIPSELVLISGQRQSIVKCRFNPNSNLELIKDGNSLRFYKDGEASNVQVEYVKEISALEHKIDEEHSVGDYIDVVGKDRISLILFEGCYNWICGKQCKFCDLHPKRVYEKVSKPTLNNLFLYDSVDQWWDLQKEKFLRNTCTALKYLLENHNFEHKHLFIMAGNLQNCEQVWKILLEFVQRLSEEFDLSNFDTIVNVCPHPNLEKLRVLKSLKIKQVQYNLEIANKELFENICPGKIDYDNFVSKLIEAVDVMGNGNVRSNFVLGIQNIDDFVNECEKLAQKGIVVDYSVFQPKKNTALENMASPLMEDVENFTIKLADIYIKYNQKPIFCSLSSRSSVINEVFYDKCQQRV